MRVKMGDKWHTDQEQVLGLHLNLYDIAVLRQAIEQTDGMSEITLAFGQVVKTFDCPDEVMEWLGLTEDDVSESAMFTVPREDNPAVN